MGVRFLVGSAWNRVGMEWMLLSISWYKKQKSRENSRTVGEALGSSELGCKVVGANDVGEAVGSNVCNQPMQTRKLACI